MHVNNYKIESYCLKCKKITENIDPEISSTSNGRAMILSKCIISGSKKFRFIKNQEEKGLLSKLGIKTPLSKNTNTGWYFVLNAIPLKWVRINNEWNCE